MSAFDKIAELTAKIEFGPDLAHELLTEMAGYEATYRRTFMCLMEIGGFRKLWTALESAAIYSMREQLDEVPASIARRHGLDKILAEMMED